MCILYPGFGGKLGLNFQGFTPSDVVQKIGLDALKLKFGDKTGTEINNQKLMAVTN